METNMWDGLCVLSNWTNDPVPSTEDFYALDVVQGRDQNEFI